MPCRLLYTSQFTEANVHRYSTENLQKFFETLVALLSHPLYKARLNEGTAIFKSCS